MNLSISTVSYEVESMDWWFIFLPIILAGEVLVWWVCWCKGGDSLSLCSFVFWPHLCQVGAASGAGVRLMRNNEDLTLGSTPLLMVIDSSPGR